MEFIKDFFFKIYGWQMDLEDLDSGSETLYQDYFQNTWDFIWILIAMLGITFVVCFVFYLVLGNKTRAFANIPTWIVMMLISCGLTFWVSRMIVYYESDEQERVQGTYHGFPNSMKTTIDSYGDMEDRIDLEPLNIAEAALDEEIESGDEEILSSCAGINVVYSFVLFLLFSWLLKRWSIHAKAIPW